MTEHDLSRDCPCDPEVIPVPAGATDSETEEPRAIWQRGYAMGVAEAVFGERVDPDLRARIEALRSVLNGILSDGPVMDGLTAEGPWWTPPDETGVRLHDSIIAASNAVDALLAATPDHTVGGEEREA